MMHTECQENARFKFIFARNRNKCIIAKTPHTQSIPALYIHYIYIYTCYYYIYIIYTCYLDILTLPAPLANTHTVHNIHSLMNTGRQNSNSFPSARDHISRR